MRRPQWMAEFERLAEAAAGRWGLTVAGIEVLGEGRHTIVRVSIEGDDGVSVDRCADVAEVLGRALDLHDPIPHRYTLEVASPGLDRPLFREADFRRFAGRKVEVTTSAPVDGRRRWRGRLLGLEGDQVAVDIDGQVTRLPLAAIARARLAVDMEDLREDFARGGHARS